MCQSAGSAVKEPAVGRKLVLAVLVSFAVKCLLAWSFPFTGDEAYFALCGKRLAWGYYDHPPMTAWLLHLLLYVGRWPLLLRLLPIVFSTAVGVGLYVLLRPYDRHKACLVTLLFTVSPVNLVFFVVTTDAPLFLFSFLSAFSLFKAEKERCYRWYLLSGLFLGLAFLSKYFAVLLGLSYAAYFLSVRKDARRIKGYLLLVLATAPFAAQNAIWNYQTGWPNLMHNYFSRLRDDSNPAINLLCLGLSMIYLMTPGVIYFLVKSRMRIWSSLRRDDLRLFALAAVVPLCVFTVVSFKKIVGPHWYVGFVPFAFVVAACVLDPQQITKSINSARLLTLIQVSAFLAAPLVPVDKLKGLVDEEDLASLVIYRYPRSLLEALEQYGDDFVLATTSYSTSALLEFYHRDRVIVFGKGTHHARQDDLLTNFKELEGRNILILHKKKVDPDDDLLYQACFDKMETTVLRIRGATFFMQFGYGFKYSEYRERHLRRALQGYHQIPDWLPGSRSFFREKYDF